jgi:hypothetical protein
LDLPLIMSSENYLQRNPIPVAPLTSGDRNTNDNNGSSSRKDPMNVPADRDPARRAYNVRKEEMIAGATFDDFPKISQGHFEKESITNKDGAIQESQRPNVRNAQTGRQPEKVQDTSF